MFARRSVRSGLASLAVAALAACGESATSDADASTQVDAGDGVMPTGMANGSVGPWEPLAPMPLPRAAACAFVSGSHVIVAGGIYRPDGGEFITTDAIHVARILPDGALGPWTTAGTTSGPVSSCTGTSRGDELYIVGSDFVSDTDEQQVWTAAVDPEGTVGSWQSLGALPEQYVAFQQHAWIHDSRLYVTDSLLPQSGDMSVVLSTEIGATGLDWTVAQWLAGFRGRSQGASAGDQLFLIGGYITGNEVVTRVDGARFLSDGELAGSTPLSPLPQPRNSGRAIVVDDYLFVIGGREQILGVPSRPDVFSASIGSDGTLGQWASQTALPEGRTSFGLVVAGDHLYVLGGGFDGPGKDSVYRARVRF